MHFIGFFALLFTLVALIGGGVFGFYEIIKSGNYRKGEKFLSLVWMERIQAISFFLISISSLILFWALGKRDFSFAYVHDYTDEFLPMFYALTAFWAGQDGSFLFWSWVLSILGAIFIFSPTYKELDQKTRVFFWGFYFLVQAFFCLWSPAQAIPF